jgi:hypothetical protein
MKILALIPKLATGGSAVVLTVLISSLTASGLQVANLPATASAPANARPTPNTLTSTAPVSPHVSSLASGDIRDIRQPRHLATVRPLGAVAVGVILLSAAAFAMWRWVRRGKFLRMLPHDIALQALEQARQLMDPQQAREYCFVVSNIIRRYVEDSFQVRAPMLTTEEFLRDLVEVQDTILEPNRSLLGEFLQHCDLAKFAGWRYSLADLEEMHASARSFVQTTAVGARTVATQKGKPQLALTTN